MPYYHCPNCERTAWLEATDEPPAQCRHCGSELALMPARHAASLTTALRARFQRDMTLEPTRVRFVRG